MMPVSEKASIRKRILWVDASCLDCAYANSVLSAYYEVRVEEDRRWALDLLQHFVPNLVIKVRGGGFLVDRSVVS